MRLRDLTEDMADPGGVVISPQLKRIVEEWSALSPDDIHNGRKAWVTRRILANADALRATKVTPIKSLFRGIGLAPDQWSTLIEQQQPIKVQWGNLSSWTTADYIGQQFMEILPNSVLLEHSFPDDQVLFYAPDFWRFIPDETSPPAAVHEREAVVYQPTDIFTITPSMVIDHIGS